MISESELFTYDGHFVSCVVDDINFNGGKDALIKFLNTNGDIHDYGAPCPKCNKWIWGFNESRWFKKFNSKPSLNGPIFIPPIGR